MDKARCLSHNNTWHPAHYIILPQTGIRTNGEGGEEEGEGRERGREGGDGGKEGGEEGETIAIWK